MSVYLYALAEGLEGVHDLRGITGEPLALDVAAGLQIVFGEVTTRPEVDRAALLNQDAVVRQLHARSAALLPMRYGACFATREEARAAIAAREAALRARLAHVRGREQMTVRFVAAGETTGIAAASAGAMSDLESRPSTPAGTPGTAYLRQRAAESTPPDIVPLLEAVAPLQRGVRIERGVAAGVVATVYHLIERVGQALMALEGTIHDLARQAGLDPKELNLDLGPLGRLT